MVGNSMNVERMESPGPSTQQAPCHGRSSDFSVQSQKDVERLVIKTSSGGHWGHLPDGWLSHSAEEYSGGWVLMDYKTCEWEEPWAGFVFLNCAVFTKS